MRKEKGQHSHQVMQLLRVCRGFRTQASSLFSLSSGCLLQQGMSESPLEKHPQTNLRSSSGQETTVACR
jgi:hypothetical protein